MCAQVCGHAGKRELSAGQRHSCRSERRRHWIEPTAQEMPLKILLQKVGAAPGVLPAHKKWGDPPQARAEKSWHDYWGASVGAARPVDPQPPP